MSILNANEVPSTPWTIVVPVKGTSNAKSRLGASRELAIAIALDTIVAALSATPNVVVVTDSRARQYFSHLAVRIIDDAGRGLNEAIMTGLLDTQGPAAVMLGDLPAVDGTEIEKALQLAAAHPRAMVADADGAGTVLLTAWDSSDHVPRFGAGSRAAHRLAGYVELGLPQSSALRRDVDTLAHLVAVADRLGRHTSAVLPNAGQDDPVNLHQHNPRWTP